MKNFLRTTLSCAVVLALPVLSGAAGKSVYGRDNRLDYFEAPASLRALADSVVSLWRAEDVHKNRITGKFDLATIPLGKANMLCPGEKFEDQASGAFCSGSLVGEDLIMTAGHCITEEQGCPDVRFVFGFRVDAAGGAGITSVDPEDVYSCSKIVTRYKAGEAGSPFPAGQNLGADYALIKLDRKAAGRKPLAINRSGEIKKDTGLFVIGHPSGLPLKVAGEAKVRDAEMSGYFVADLDTFGGNSGSAVFNSKTSEIEGILVRGASDYDYSSGPGCFITAVFPQDGARGEDVTRVSALAAEIPPLSGAKSAEPETVTVKVDSTGLQNVAPLRLPVNFQ